MKHIKLANHRATEMWAWEKWPLHRATGIACLRIWHTHLEVPMAGTLRIWHSHLEAPMKAHLWAFSQISNIAVRPHVWMFTDNLNIDISYANISREHVRTQFVRKSSYVPAAGIISALLGHDNDHISSLYWLHGTLSTWVSSSIISFLFESYWHDSVLYWQLLHLGRRGQLQNRVSLPPPLLSSFR